MRDVARISDGPVYYFYAPMILPDAATARALRTQPEVARAISRFPDVTKAVVGLGAWAEAVRAGLRRGFATSLITHTAMARRLLED